MEINKVYTISEIILQMQKHFETQGFIQLENFLSDDILNIREKITLLEKKKKYLATSHCKSIFNTKNVYDVEVLAFVEYFKSKEFITYIEEITQLELNLEKFEICSYEHRDYALLNDKQNSDFEYLHLIFDISDEFDEKSGGNVVYTTSQEEVLYLNPTMNSLSIVYHPKELMHYLKYLNCKSKDKKIVRVEMKFSIE